MNEATTGWPDPETGLQLIFRLVEASARIGPESIGRVVRRELATEGLTEVQLLLVDYEHRELVPFDDGEAVDIGTTMAGRAFIRSEAVPSTPDADGSVHVWFPLLDGVERLGVLGVRIPTPSERATSFLEHLAGVVAGIVVSKSQYGDKVQLVRRQRPMNMSAELRWSDLPPLAHTGERFGVACFLAPAYELAGDAFDYAFNEGTLHLAIFDPAGHDLEAARVGNLALAAYRNARRQGFDLHRTHSFIDDAISSQFDPERFTTGQMATIDEQLGTLRWLNAGHPLPILLRGERTAVNLDCAPSLPWGMGGEPAAVAEVGLEPGDSVLFFSDGIIETRSPAGEPFGRERLIDFVRRMVIEGHTVPETVRRLGHVVLEHAGGSVRDDATLLVASWHP